MKRYYRQPYWAVQGSAGGAVYLEGEYDAEAMGGDAAPLLVSLQGPGLQLSCQRLQQLKGLDNKGRERSCLLPLNRQFPWDHLAYRLST